MPDKFESPTYLKTEATVFAYLDKLAKEGEPIPGTRKIRTDCGVSQKYICIIVRKWKEKHLAEEVETLAKAGDEALSEGLTQAFDNVRVIVAKDLQAVRDRYAKADQERAADYERRENELLDRLNLAEEKADEELVKSTRLAEQLRLETEARKTAEAQRDEARKEAERTIEELRADINRLTSELETAQVEALKLMEEEEALRKQLADLERKTAQKE